MSERYESREDLAAKCENEGLDYAIHDYGITHDQLPLTAPRKVIEAWKAVENTKDDMATIEEWLFGDEPWLESL